MLADASNPSPLSVCWQHEALNVLWVTEESGSVSGRARWIWELHHYLALAAAHGTIMEKSSFSHGYCRNTAHIVWSSSSSLIVVWRLWKHLTLVYLTCFCLWSISLHTFWRTFAISVQSKLEITVIFTSKAIMVNFIMLIFLKCRIAASQSTYTTL